MASKLSEMVCSRVVTHPQWKFSPLLLPPTFMAPFPGTPTQVNSLGFRWVSWIDFNSFQTKKALSRWLQNPSELVRSGDFTCTFSGRFLSPSFATHLDGSLPRGPNLGTLTRLFKSKTSRWLQNWVHYGGKQGRDSAGQERTALPMPPVWSVWPSELLRAEQPTTFHSLQIAWPNTLHTSHSAPLYANPCRSAPV